MRRYRSILSLLVLALLGLMLFVACQKNNAPAVKPSTTHPVTVTGRSAGPGSPIPPQQEAIADAIQNYIRNVRHVDTSRMTMRLSDCRIESDKATATVTYGLQDGAMPPMVYDYELTRRDGLWVVTASHPSGGEGHAGTLRPGSGMPAGHPGAPAMESAHGATNELPPGHPAVSGGSSTPGNPDGK